MDIFTNLFGSRFPEFLAGIFIALFFAAKAITQIKNNQNEKGETTSLLNKLYEIEYNNSKILKTLETELSKGTLECIWSEKEKILLQEKISRIFSTVEKIQEIVNKHE